MTRAVRRQWIPLCIALTACQADALRIDDGPIPDDDRPAEVVRSAVTPPPISGGTLVLVDDGLTAVASDPDRDLVYVVDLARGRQTHAIELPRGDEPGRLVAGSEGIVHVIARRGGAVVDIHYASGTIDGRRRVCANPRGIAYEPEADSLHVACAGGELVSLPAGGGKPWRRVHVAEDLRDVLLTDDGLAVTRFRDAEVLQLDENGTVLEEHRLLVLQRTIESLIDRMHPNSAWRTVAMPGGGWLMLHQVSTERELDVTRPGEGDEPPSESGSESGDEHEDGGGYADSGNPCPSVTHPVLTIGTEPYVTRNSPLLVDMVLPVDAAASPSGDWIAVAVAGNRAHNEKGLARIPTEWLVTGFTPGCEAPQGLPAPEGQYTAVAIDPQGWIVAQSREPARLVRIDPEDPHDPIVVLLEGEPRRDTGHDLFHLDAGGGISCATCHPEGGDDGQVWQFRGIGPRHTPSLAIGLAGTAPFHWEGDLGDMRALVDHIHRGRMGGAPMSDAWVEALESYLYSIPIPVPTRARSDSAATRGRALFSSWGCGSCHYGEALASNENVDLGMGFGLQVPGLRGVALHPPYMHDGRAEDLSAAVLDMLARTRPEHPTPSAEQLDDMVAYLESL